MNRLQRNMTGILIAMSTLIFSGCAVHHVHSDGPGYGPPPHAPAHGYRAKYHDHDLVFDSGLGVYVVTGWPEHYYLDGIYYRHSHDGWYHSKYLDRDWGHYDDDARVPPGLAKKYGHGPGSGRGHGKGKGKGKERD